MPPTADPSPNDDKGKGGTPAPEGKGKGGEPVLPEELRAAFRTFADEMKLSDKDRKTFHDNLKLRYRNSALRKRLEELEAAGPQPKDGSIVLSKEDATLFGEFKKLNLKPADITAAIAERDTLKSKKTETDLAEQFAKASETLGFANTALFTRTMTREKLHLEFKDVTIEEDGERKKVSWPFVRPLADDKKELEALDEYIERELGSEMIVALQAEPAADDEAEDEGEEEGVFMATGTDGVRRRVGGAPSRKTATEPTRGVRMPVTRGARPLGSSPNQKKQQEKIVDEVRRGMKIRI